VPFVVDAARAERINNALAEWRQGDVASLRVVNWIGAPSEPLTEASAQAASDTDLATATVHSEVDAVVVITQTCDIVRDCGTRPLVVVAPLVRLDGPAASEALRGMRPRFANVPALGPTAFADLDHIVTVEKSVLASADRMPGTSSDAEIRRFGLQVGRKHGWFAFPDDLAVALRGLIPRISDKHAKQSREGRALAALETIRATGSPDWSAERVDVFLVFAPPTRDEADEVMTETEWDDVVAGWLARTEPFGLIASIQGAMIPLDELTAREYLDSDALDLDYLSY
jgi:hypothetical protein